MMTQPFMLRIGKALLEQAQFCVNVEHNHSYIYILSGTPILKGKCALLRKGLFGVGDDIVLENYLSEQILNYSSKSLNSLNLYLCTTKSDLYKQKKGGGVFDAKFCLETLKEYNCKQSFFQVRPVPLTGSDNE